jgi:hypothetical protein
MTKSTKNVFPTWLRAIMVLFIRKHFARQGLPKLKIWEQRLVSLYFIFVLSGNCYFCQELVLFCSPPLKATSQEQNTKTGAGQQLFILPRYFKASLST